MPHIPVSEIDLDGSTQSRATTRLDIVDEYARKLTEANNWPFPAVELFEDPRIPNWFVIGDGWHRVLAAKQTNCGVLANVHSGTRRDAILFSVGANATHGIRRTNADKRRSVELLLADPEWSQRSDKWIAKAANVSGAFVSSLRENPPSTVVCQNGIIQDRQPRSKKRDPNKRTPEQEAIRELQSELDRMEQRWHDAMPRRHQAGFINKLLNHLEGRIEHGTTRLECARDETEANAIIVGCNVHMSLLAWVRENSAADI